MENVGKETKEKCPKCGRKVLYNGNYFCEEWTNENPVPEGECDWILPHPPETREDREMSIKLVGYWEEELPNCGGYAFHKTLD